MKLKKLTLASLLLGSVSNVLFATNLPKPATEFTKQLNQQILSELPFSDTADFDNARRGFIAKPDPFTVKDAQGKVVWDLESFKSFINASSAAPDTVNPSLWRNASLNMEYGLFKVTDGIYQVRGFDVSNITFIQGKTGWIVFDPLVSVEVAKAALDLINQKVGYRPVVALVYSHSHVDHYGGAAALVKPSEVKSGKVKIIAPKGFSEHAISENVIAGNAMTRRAVYQFGVYLPRSEQGTLGSGLGMSTSTGTISFVPPNISISKPIETMVVDGVKMVFHSTPGTEAPAEMNTWFPDKKAMWMAENTTNTMHNILTLRGALVRDASV